MERDHRKQQKVIEYYQTSTWLYKYFWYSGRSMGLNYGFWWKGTKGRDEAIRNRFQYVIDQAGIKKNMLVLDAGCGVAGGAIYVAKHAGAIVEAITITPKQVQEGERNVRKAGVDDLVRVREMDYTKTSYPNNYFDVVFAVESVCYAHPKSLFLKEAYRVLKRGGVLLISDGYCVRKPRNGSEKGIIKRFCENWRLPKLCEYKSMTRDIQKVGFRKVNVWDMTKAVRPSFKDIQLLVGLARPFEILNRYWHNPIIENIVANATALEMSIKGVEAGLMGHFTHVARK